jgi:hypothetical protein
MADYAKAVKAVKANSLERVSKEAKAYTITLLGILNRKLLYKKNRYPYCAATGRTFEEYVTFECDLAKFGSYVKLKAEASSQYEYGRTAAATDGGGQKSVALI